MINQRVARFLGTGLAVACAAVVSVAVTACGTGAPILNSTTHSALDAVHPTAAVSLPAGVPSVISATGRGLRGLTERARSAATSNDDPAATGQAVRTTYRDAERLLFANSTSSTPPGGTPVWVIEVRGSFTCYSCSVPHGGSPPKGTAIAQILDARTLQEYAQAFMPKPLELAALGSVVSLPM